MKKITMLIAFFAFISWQGNAQVSDYNFAASSGTFDTLVAGVNVPGVEADSYISGKLPIGFTFTFDGVAFDSLKASSNGFLSFGSSTSSQTTNNLDNVSATSRPLIAPLWDDNDGSATGGVSYASYLTTGTAPNRVFTFEWKNWEWRWSSSTPTISFQVKLYETSNVVEFVYRQEAGTVSSGSASIGLTGVSTFMSLDGSGTSPNTSSTTETSSISTKPATGQVYSFTPASCPEPGTLAANNVTATAADLSWVESGSSTLWELEWDTAGFTVGSGTNVASGTATSPYALSTLTANTSYEFYVRSACGLNDSSNWAGPFSFTTLCGTITPDFTETFDSFVPSCWDEADAGSIATGPSSFGSGQWHNSSSIGSSVAINLYTTSRSDWVLSPNFDLSVGGYEVSIDVAVAGWNSSSSATMGSDDSVRLAYTEDGVTWNVLSTWTAADALSNSLNTIVVSVPSTGTTVQFGILATDGPVDDSEDYDFHFDNFIVRTPPSCSAPSSLTAASITVSSADLGWTENGTATTWDIEWDTAGFTQGTGTMVTGTTINPHSLSALTSNTSYEFYVRADCGGSVTSAWVGPISFSTLCNTFSVPFQEGFNSNSQNLGCWLSINNNNDGTQWGLYASNFYEGDQAIGINTDFNSGANDDYLVTPQITLTGADQLRYWYRAQSANEPNDYKILVSTTDALPASFTDTLLTDTASSTTYAEKTIDLSAYSGNVFIAFYIPVGGLDGWVLYIDDVNVELIPTCPTPSFLTVSNATNASADLGWTENGSATAWQIEWDTTGFSQGSGTLTPASSNPFTLTGLSSNTSYQYYLRSVCGVGDSSIWIGPLAFSTTPDTINVFPYTNDLESGLGLYLGLRDSAESSASIDTIADNASTYGVLMTGNTFTGWSGGSTSSTEAQAFGDNSSHISGIDMIVDATALSAVKLTFDMLQKYTYGANYSWARVTVNGVQVGSSVNPTTQDADTFSTASIDLSAYAGTSFVLSIEHSGKYNAANYGSNGDDAYVDNIEIYVPVTVSALVDSNATCFGFANGGATASNVGGLSPYTYLWSNSATTASITGVVAGTYTVTIVDSKNDSATTSVTITEPAALALSLGNDTSICSGSSLTLDAGTFATYLWDDATTMQTRAVSSVLGASTYSVTVTNAAGCTGSDAIDVTGYAPVVVSLGNDTSVCDAVTLTLDAGTFASYVWSDASTMQTLTTVSTLGAVDYSVVVIDANGCTGNDTISVTGTAAVVVSLGADTALCFEETLTLDAGTFASYLWSDASTMQTLTVNGSKLGATTYSVAVLNANGCAGNDDIVVIGFPEVIVNLGADTNIWDPSVTVYTLDAGTGFSTYAWSDGVTTTQTYDVTPSADSNVSVVVTDMNGCTGSDTVIVDFVLGINAFEASTLKMYPNPAVDQITIELSNFKNVSEVNVTFITITGQTVLSQKIGVNGNSYVGTFDVSTLATGTYFVQFEANGEVVVRQFVIK